MSAIMERTPRGSLTGAAVTDRNEASFGSNQRQESVSKGTAAATTPRRFDGSEDIQISSSALLSGNETARSTKLQGSRPSALLEASEGRQRAERTRSAKQYLAMARPILVKRVCDHLAGLAAHAQTPGAGVYVFQIDRLATEAMERFFDDGFLDLLLAVRNALVINNAWMRYTAERVGQIQSVIREYAEGPAENGREFRRGIVKLNQLGIDTTPFELPPELLLDEEE